MNNFRKRETIDRIMLMLGQVFQTLVGANPGLRAIGHLVPEDDVIMDGDTPNTIRNEHF